MSNKIIENKYKVGKVMWNKLLKYGHAEEFNEMVECLDMTEWYSSDNGKTVFEPRIVAFNAAIMYLTSKFPKKNDK